MGKKIDTLYELCETLTHEIESANDKISQTGNKLTAGDVEYLDKLTHTLKSLKETIAMVETEENGYSGRYWDGKYYYGNMPETSRNAYNRNGNIRNGLGLGARYGSTNGYSRGTAREDFAAELYDLMEKAPDERTRKKLEHFMSEM